jgi:hypothetical protein
MSRMSVINSTNPRAATPQINSTTKVKDSDMARSLIVRHMVTVDLRGAYVP